MLEIVVYCVVSFACGAVSVPLYQAYVSWVERSNTEETTKPSTFLGWDEEKTTPEAVPFGALCCAEFPRTIVSPQVNKEYEDYIRSLHKNPEFKETFMENHVRELLDDQETREVNARIDAAINRMSKEPGDVGTVTPRRGA